MLKFREIIYLLILRVFYDAFIILAYSKYSSSNMNAVYCIKGEIHNILTTFCLENKQNSKNSHILNFLFMSTHANKSEPDFVVNLKKLNDKLTSYKCLL